MIGDGLEPKNLPDSTFNEKKRETTGAREDLILEKKEMRTQLVFGPQNENGTSFRPIDDGVGFFSCISSIFQDQDMFLRN